MSSRRGVLPFTDTLASNVGARAAAKGESLDVASTYAGCVPEPLDAKGVALLILANIVIYNGYATETNKKEAATMGESEVNIQRRKYAVLVLLQAGIALFRRGSGKVCTEEELRALNQKRVYGE